MPANAVVLVVLAGLLPLVVTLHQDRAGERVGLACWRVRLTGPARAMTVVGAALVVTTAAVLLVPPALGEWHHAKANGILRSARPGGTIPTQRDLALAREELRAAVAWNRWSPAGWADLAEVSGQLGNRAFAYGLTSTGERIANPTVAARFDAAQPFLAEAYDAHRATLELRPRASAQHERMGRFLAGTEGIRRAVPPGSVKGPVDPRLATLFGSDRSARAAALGHFREAIRWDPRNAYYHRSLGLFALDVADREVAVAALQEALTLRPDFLPVIVDELLARRVDDEFVRTTMPRNFELVLDLARELGARGKQRAASTAFEDAVRLAATPAQEVEARLAYGRALLDRQDPAAALEQGRRALVLAPKEAEVFVLFAAVYDRTNKDVDAEMALTTAVALAEPGPAALRNRLRGELAALLSRRGQVDRAMAMWRQVLRENPNDAWAHLELGRVLEQRGDAAGALHAFRSAYAVAGEDFDLHWALARALRDSGYLREAVGIYDAARRLRPAEGDLGAELGDLYARIGLTDRAMEQYRQVLRREPDHPGARRGLASVKASAGS
jgi:tetratricopeptide (TPR) repeat protein